MNAKTLEAIRRHGENLLAIFPNATERDPVALCKKLRRIETAISKPLVDYCNGEFDAGEDGEKLDALTDKAMAKLKTLLGLSGKPGEPGLLINRDPRGYALKIDDAWMRDNGWKLNRSNRHTNGSGSIAVARLHRDMGGYGIIAPDLTEAK